MICPSAGHFYHFLLKMKMFQSSDAGADRLDRFLGSNRSRSALNPARCSYIGLNFLVGQPSTQHLSAVHTEMMDRFDFCPMIPAGNDWFSWHMILRDVSQPISTSGGLWLSLDAKNRVFETCKSLCTGFLVFIRKTFAICGISTHAVL